MSIDLNLKNLEGHNADHVICSDYGTLESDRYELQTCTAEFKIRADLWAQLPVVNSPHPIFTFIGAEHVSLGFSKGWAVATIKYAGVKVNDNDFTNPIYELDSSVAEEPIETLGWFTSFAGTPDKPLNGSRWRRVGEGFPSVVFDGGDKCPDGQADAYVFDGFSVKAGGVDNPFAKIESYFDGGRLTWTATKYGAASSSVIARGGIIDTPEGPAPSLMGKRNWLNMGVTSTPRGAARKHTEKWMSSGPRGWNDDIYGRPS